MARITNADGSRWYTWPNEDHSEILRHWSVTTILNLGVPKEALIGWAARTVAEFAVDNLSVLVAMERRSAAKVNKAKDPVEREDLQREGRYAAIDWLKGAPNRSKGSAAIKGSHAHAAIEAYKLGRPYPGVPLTAREYYEGFLALIEEQQPIVLQTEASVYSRRRLYAGTLDTIMVWPNLERSMAEAGMNVEDYWPRPWGDPRGPVLLGDYKTGKGPKKRGVYGETAQQASAYGHSEFIAGPDAFTEYPIGRFAGCGCDDCESKADAVDWKTAPPEAIPQIDGAVALHLQPGWSEVVPLQVGLPVWRSFLHAYEVARWVDTISKDAVGVPIVRAEKRERTRAYSSMRGDPITNGHAPQLQEVKA